MQDKLDKIQTRFEELERLLQDESVINDQQKIKEVSQEYDDLKEVMAVKKRLEKITDRKSTRLNSSHSAKSRMPSSA